MGSKSLQNFLDESMSNLKSRYLFDTVNTVKTTNGPVIRILGKDYINLSSNDYLGFSKNPLILETFIKAANDYGVGSGASRTINGTLDLHEILEKKLSGFEHTEAALIFQSAYNTNIGVIPSLMDKYDAILSDELNHASIIDGCRLSGAEIVIYKHSDMKDLKRKAVELREIGKYKKIMVVTDGVFPMDGDISMLSDIVEIAEELDLISYVDDAHAFGILGQNGSGSAAHHDVIGKVDIQVATFSKAMGVIGGYVTGSKKAIDWLKVTSRPFIFSTAMTPPDTAACIKALDILSESTELIDKLWHNGRYFKRELKKMGFNIGFSQTPITPCIIGDEEKTLQFSHELYDEGVYVKSSFYPVVPLGKARVRNIPTASLNENLMDKALSAYEKVGKKLAII